MGERVRVGGEVVAGSWDKKSNPMRFAIREEGDKTNDGPTIKVVYNGTVPSTFGDGVVAIVTGELSTDGTINSDDMITKCPSKYTSATGALSVADLLNGGGDLTGKSVKVTGYVSGEVSPPGGDVRFTIANTTRRRQDGRRLLRWCYPAGHAGRFAGRARRLARFERHLRRGIGGHVQGPEEPVDRPHDAAPLPTAARLFAASPPD